MSEEYQLSRQLRVVRDRAMSLCQRVSVAPDQESTLLGEAVEELSTALEELQVVEEQLRQQNEELFVTQQSVEIERQRYQELFDFAPDGYLVTDAEGVIWEANTLAALLLNRAQHRLTGKPLALFILEEQRSDFRRKLTQLRATKQVQTWELWITPTQKEAFHAEFKVMPVRNTEGQVVTLRWIMRDITSRKQVEAKIHQVELENLQLREATRLKSYFLGMMSHELRTPMNAILGFTQLLLRPQAQLNFQQSKLAERIATNAKHLLNLIESVLDFAQLDRKNLELKKEIFDLEQLVTTTVEDVRFLAKQKALKLQVDIDLSNPQVVNDSLRLRQTLVNLLTNAIKFTTVGGVTVKVWEIESDRIGISVTDTGIGIAEHDQPYVFREFWQVSQATTRRYEGTGLGLSITRALVELMQGTICVQSYPGQGSTFTIKIPRQIESPISRILT